MKHNTINKIMLTGLLGLGMAGQANATNGRSNNLQLPQWAYQKHLHIVVAPVAIAVATGLGLRKLYNWYTRSPLQDFQDHLKGRKLYRDLMNDLKKNNFNEDNISSVTRKKNPKIVAEVIKDIPSARHILQEQINARQSTLWVKIQSKIRFTSLNNYCFNINDALENNPDDIAFYNQHKSWFDKLAETQCRIEMKRKHLGSF